MGCLAVHQAGPFFDESSGHEILMNELKQVSLTGDEIGSTPKGSGEISVRRAGPVKRAGRKDRRKEILSQTMPL
jgi:hypothetical protein